MITRLVIIGIVAAYAYKAIFLSTRSWSGIAKAALGMGYWGFTLAVLGLTLYLFFNWVEVHENRPVLADFVMGATLTFFFTTLIVSIFHLMDDAVWLVNWIRSLASKKDALPGETITRASFLSKTGLAIGAVVFGSFMWGLTKGKFSFRVIDQKLNFANLPKAFDGLKIVQISDAHLGSFNNNFEPVKHIVQMINDLDADYIFFTGDLVNSHHSEAEPWIDIFAQLKAKEGKFSILGNHDYGYYGDFSEEEQVAIRQGVIDIEKKMGFQPLLNENVHLTKGDDKIALLGVENWGKSHWFPKVGDIDKAMQGVEKDTFKILLSHDPTHWDEHVMGLTNVDLTMSGHTHGAQMGISIPGVLEISPSQLLFKRSKGIYAEGKQQLYVNRGLGYLIFPGRVGMAPEITCFELTRS
ncbi:MAG: putative MPP superfamily phosphohydrolase [Flavobacteriales bacterium]|jgi:predicted MPP superfamily phosphohydrolase